MPLLMAYRRTWAIFIFLVLLLPTIGLVAPDLPAPLRTVIAPEERWWVNAAERIDPYINQTFGFRGAVLAAHNAYGRALGQPSNDRVLEGRDGALFIKEDMALEQSLGQVRRDAAITGIADVAQRLDDYMRGIGGRFAMVVPPNGHTVNFELLPDSVKPFMNPPTEYDLLAAEMARRHLPFVDLRPVLAKAKEEGPVQFRIDTHWNHRGALIGFNAAMAAVGRPDLQVDAAEALGPPVPKTSGDLVRLSGRTTAQRPDVDYEPQGPFLPPADLKPVDGLLPPPESARDPFPSTAFSTGHDGPRILVIGDSNTQHFWTGLLAARAGMFGWMHHRYCKFDMEAVKRFKPDILLYVPAERSLPCKR